MTNDELQALPKRARLDLLTHITLDRLVQEHSAKHLVDAILREIETDTDAADLRDLGVRYDE